ncbi:hypothetical protein [Breoghania sp.]|uniref:hypothetical protein n=1 Tax=Breoghania sp. TaxID=2065378 RepID=UPI00261A3566|nr:hypothetical protein [Breoghania sp.]MDJ0932080.1 hypothetical protein [Breoghania sp.]
MEEAKPEQSAAPAEKPVKAAPADKTPSEAQVDDENTGLSEDVTIDTIEEEMTKLMKEIGGNSKS